MSHYLLTLMSVKSKVDMFMQLGLEYSSESYHFEAETPERVIEKVKIMQQDYLTKNKVQAIVVNLSKL